MIEGWVFWGIGVFVTFVGCRWEMHACRCIYLVSKAFWKPWSFLVHRNQFFLTVVQRLIYGLCCVYTCNMEARDKVDPSKT